MEGVLGRLMQPMYIPIDDGWLYAVLTRARADASDRAAASDRAILWCSPMGQEAARTHRISRQLAKLLSPTIHVMRFDYVGTGDSSGVSEDVDSVDTWIRNIGSAIDALKQQTGVKSVGLAGMRFGASLAWKAALQRPDVHSLSLWDPVVDGNSNLQMLRGMHAEILDLWVCPMGSIESESQEELLGTLWQKPLLSSIETLQVDWALTEVPQLIVTSQPDFIVHPEPSLQRVVRLDDDPTWMRRTEIETTYSRPVALQEMVSGIQELFDRRDRFRDHAKTSAETSRISSVESKQFFSPIQTSGNVEASQ